ncbi:hypothetical protein AK812_SmicGene43762 [Symbiodinium microadriaticum]|uniref:Uncharacterized protein n=1 Tax=Symbiodinium microadriaticum TaxID=2951 RepID=A0A1Q9C063_SYMMI|nr:hypothetical protein AK812_SmicGene43762 [Symbiodinium microadriaticum]
MDRVNAEANAESLIARGNEMRDAQLRDLLAMRGMFGRSSSSSSTMRPLKNIFKKDDGDKTEKLIAELMERDVKAFDESKRHESSTPQAKPLARPAASSLGDTERLAKIEAGYVEQMTELRAALRQAKQTEEHLRDDRNHWRQAAEYFQQDSQQDNGDEQEEEEEEDVSPSESPTNIGPGGPGGGDDHDDSPSRGPNHEGWISWIHAAFRPDPDIEGMNESGHIKFKSIDVKLGDSPALKMELLVYYDMLSYDDPKRSYKFPPFRRSHKPEIQEIHKGLGNGFRKRPGGTIKADVLLFDAAVLEATPRQAA